MSLTKSIALFLWDLISPAAPGLIVLGAVGYVAWANFSTLTSF